MFDFTVLKVKFRNYGLGKGVGVERNCLSVAKSCKFQGKFIVPRSNPTGSRVAIKRRNESGSKACVGHQRVSMKRWNLTGEESDLWHRDKS